MPPFGARTQRTQDRLGKEHRAIRGQERAYEEWCMSEHSVPAVADARVPTIHERWWPTRVARNHPRGNATEACVWPAIHAH